MCKTFSSGLNPIIDKMTAKEEAHSSILHVITKTMKKRVIWLDLLQARRSWGAGELEASAPTLCQPANFLDFMKQLYCFQPNLSFADLHLLFNGAMPVLIHEHKWCIPKLFRNVYEDLSMRVDL